jgi:hypothetical protein
MNWGRSTFFALFVFGGIFFFVGCKPQWVAVQSEGNYLPIKEIQDDSLSLAFLKPYSDSVFKQMGQILCHSALALPKIKGSHETALGNFMSDVLLNQGRKIQPGVQASLLNLGGIRASLPQGPITLGNVYSLMPFENRVVLIQLGPKETKEMFRYIGEHPGTPFAGFELRCEEGTWKGWLNGTAFPESDSLLVATSDFLAQGGDKMNFFLPCPLKSDPGILLRDAIVGYMTDLNIMGQLLNSRLDGRIHACIEK